MFKKLLMALCLTPSLSWAATDLSDVNTIIEKANNTAFYTADDGRATTRMTIVDSQGRKQVRQFTIIRRDIEDGGDQQFLVFFSRPSDIKKTTFLVNKHPGKEDDRWLYLPGLDLVKRIAAGDNRTSFVGSHFFYEDVSGRDLDADKHELIETNDQFYLIKNTPKAPAKVEFSEYTVWIDKVNMMPIKTEYKDKSGILYRRIEALKLQTIDGYVTATKMKASNLRDNSYTINEMRYIKYNIGIPKKVFNERSLRTPPREWLKSR